MEKISDHHLEVNMESNTVSTHNINPGMIVLLLAAAGLIFLVLTGKKVPFVNSDRAALLVLIALGMTLCTPGIGRIAANHAWLHPFSILSCIIGAGILVIGFAAVFGKVLPPLENYHQAFILISILAGIKLILSNLTFLN